MINKAIRLSTLEKLCEIFDYQPNDLFEYKDKAVLRGFSQINKERITKMRKNKCIFIALLSSFSLSSCDLYLPATPIKDEELRISEIESIKRILSNAESLSYGEVYYYKANQTYAQQNDFAKSTVTISTSVYKGYRVITYDKYVNELGITKIYKGEKYSNNGYVGTDEEYLGFFDEDNETFKARYYISSSFFAEIINNISSGTKEQNFQLNEEKNILAYCSLALKQDTNLTLPLSEKVFEITSIRTLSILNNFIWIDGLEEDNKCRLTLRFGV